MSRIRSRGNKATELALARLLRVQRISGWRRHLLIRATVDSSKLIVDSPKRRVVGRRRREESHSSKAKVSGSGQKPDRASSPRLLRVKPDFVFLKSRTAVFVDGCFWHGCPRHATKPKGNAAFWRRKLSANKQRDALVTRSLRRAGWRVIRIWEHELQKVEVRSQKGEPNRVIRRIQRCLTAK